MHEGQLTELLPKKRIFDLVEWNKPADDMYMSKKTNVNYINPLSPNIHIQILQTDLYTFS